MLFDVRIINQKKTCKQAKEVLKVYRRLERISGTGAPRITATYSLEPRSYTGRTSRPIEACIVRQEEAMRELEPIEKAINTIYDELARKIIILKFCDIRELSDKEIYLTLDISSSEFYRRVNKGLLEFAEEYKQGKLIAYDD